MADLQEWAADRPLFTLNEAERALGIKRATLREKLSRLTDRGDLIRIERGKYTVHADPVIYATHIETPSYLSLWSGLRWYDLTTQQPTHVQVIAATSRDDPEGVEFFTSKTLFGYGKHRYDGFEVFVADRERLLIDCLTRSQVSVAELTELVSVADIEKAVRYADRYGKNALKKRLGYLFEHLRGEVREDLQVDDRNYPVLDLARPVDGPTDPAWRLRVNSDAVPA